jgi:hypothetical protein
MTNTQNETRFFLLQEKLQKNEKYFLLSQAFFAEKN